MSERLSCIARTIGLAGLAGVCIMQWSCASQPDKTNPLPSAAPSPALNPGHDPTAPAGVDPALWLELNAELQRVLAASGRKITSSGPPSSPLSAVSDFYLHSTGPGSASMSWTYRNQGDYDQNGVVSISDLTPIGMHFGKDSTDEDWLKAQLADGDRNGEVNISDVTPIGQNFGNEVDGWYIEESTDLIFPNWQLIGTMSGFSGTQPPEGGPLQMGTAMGGLTSGRYYRVVPFAGDTHAGTDVPGIPGHPAGFELSSAGSWPLAEADSFNSGRASTGGPLSPQLIWANAVDGEVLGAPVSSTRAVFATTTRDIAGGDLYGFGLLSGEQLFHFRSAASFIGSPAVSYDGKVFCIDYLGRLHCFAQDGVLLFTRDLGEVCRSGLNLGEQGRIYLASDDAGQGRLHCLDARGQQLWTAQLASSLVFGLPLVTSADGALVLESGGILEHFSFGGGFASSGNLLHPASGSVVANGLGGLYALANIPQGAGQASGTLYLLDGNMQTDWIYGGQGICTGSPSVMPDGSAVFCVGNFQAEPPSGEVLWIRADGALDADRQPGAAIGKPAVDISGNAYVSVAGTPGTTGLYCYSDAHIQLWFHPTGELPPTSPSIVAPNLVCFGTQQIFAEAEQSEVICLGTPVL